MQRESDRSRVSANFQNSWILIVSSRRPAEMAALLRIAGYFVAVAGDPTEAAPDLRRAGPAVLLADYPARWPADDLPANVRAQKPDIVVIAMVDLPDVEGARAALRAGYDDVCSTAIPPDALLAKIRTHLEAATS